MGGETFLVTIPALHSQIRVRLISPETYRNIMELPENEMMRELILQGVSDIETFLAKAMNAIKGTIRNTIIEGGNCMLHTSVKSIRSEVANEIMRVNGLTDVSFRDEEITPGVRFTIVDGEFRISK